MQADDHRDRSVWNTGFESLSCKETKDISGICETTDTSDAKLTDSVLTATHRQHLANCVTILHHTVVVLCSHNHAFVVIKSIAGRIEVSSMNINSTFDNIIMFKCAVLHVV